MVPADELVAAARDAEQRAAAATAGAEQARADRDRLIGQLYAEHGWTIRRIAAEVGVSPALVGLVCRAAALARVRDSR